MALVPFVFANSVGQIPLSELDVNFANVKAFALTAGNVTGNVQANITSLGTLTSLTVNGNVNANNFVGNTLTISGTTNFSNLSTTGNITGTNITATGRIISNSEIVANSISTSQTIVANTLLANSGIIGLTTGVSTFFLGNTVASTVFFAGNASNVYVANVNSFTRISGNLTANGTISASGNVTAANFLTSGAISAAGNITLSGNAVTTTAANGTNTTQIATTAFVTNATQNLIPTGVIVMWSGSIASIPAGWALCNGANGTPDLRNRFLVGAGNTYAVGATGGSADATLVSHTHTANSVVNDPGHNHSYVTYANLLPQQGATTNCWTGTASATTGNSTTGITVATTIDSSGSSGTNANLPPYYALAYIMKL